MATLTEWCSDITQLTHKELLPTWMVQIIGIKVDERAYGRKDLRSGCRFTSVIYSKCTPDATFQTMCNVSKKRHQLLANLSKTEMGTLTTRA